MVLGVCWSQNPCLPLNQLVFEHCQWPDLLSARFYTTVGFLGRGGEGEGMNKQVLCEARDVWLGNAVEQATPLSVFHLATLVPLSVNELRKWVGFCMGLS